MNVIKQLTVNVSANLRYDLPESGKFIFMWAFSGTPFSATYRFNGEQLQVFVDGHGWQDAGCGVADDYYTLSDLREVVKGTYNVATQFIAVVVVEVEA